MRNVNFFMILKDLWRVNLKILDYIVLCLRFTGNVYMDWFVDMVVNIYRRILKISLIKNFMRKNLR